MPRVPMSLALAPMLTSTDPLTMKKAVSPSSPSAMIVSPALNDTDCMNASSSVASGDATGESLTRPRPGRNPVEATFRSQPLGILQAGFRGDVVEEADGDLMGDGVNIAARLEGVAEPGAICLSEDAYRQVRARLDLAVSDLGQKDLKNIAEPVRVYSLQVGLPAQPKPAAPAEPAKAEPPAPRLALPDKPSIAVLAFQNMSGDAEQEYFVDGMV